VEDLETPKIERWTNEITAHPHHVAIRCGMVASTVPASAKCMIDEGNGRYTPCEALYKSNKSKKCMIDEGNGRYTPCEALVKPKKQKKR